MTYFWSSIRSFGNRQFSFHCSSVNGHLRMGSFVFIWRNAFGQTGLGLNRNEWGETLIMVGARDFHFF